MSNKSIDTAINELQKQKKLIQEKSQRLVASLVDMGVEIARANYLSYPKKSEYASGLGAKTIQGIMYANGNKGVIFTNDMVAIMVEFGTGVVGANSPHPNPKNYTYDVNSHGDKGWYYYNDKLHWTKGMPSRPYMYNTAQELRTIAKDIAKVVFSNG